MLFSISTIIAVSAGIASAASIPAKRGRVISVTPHDQFSSSIGVLGCKIDTNRVAYWPEEIGCDNICVKVSYKDRHVFLLRVDNSGGAHDISYDAWNKLVSGKSAKEAPQQGGGVEMTYEDVDASKCHHLLHDGKLPFTAANGMTKVSQCLAQKNSWIAKNYQLFNILDPVCHYGFDEPCTLAPGSNQATCAHPLGANDPLNLKKKVMNIAYGTGKPVAA